MVLLISVLAPVITCVWFTIVGGSGLFFELENDGWDSYSEFKCYEIRMETPEELDKRYEKEINVSI